MRRAHAAASKAVLQREMSRVVGRRGCWGSPKLWMRLAFTSAFLLTVGCPSVASAYRPFDGTDADVAKAGEFELELGPGYLAGRGMQPSLALPALVLNQGLVTGWELVVDGRNIVTRAGSGGLSASLQDTDVQLKTVLRRGSLQGANGPSIATEFGALLPTTLATDEGGFGADANLIVSHRWPALTVHLNAGAMRMRTPNYDTVSSVIVEGPSPTALRPVAEVLVEHELGGTTMVSALAGAIWVASENLALDIATRGALIDGAPAAEVRMGLTWTFSVWNTAQSAPSSSEPQTIAAYGTSARPRRPPSGG
jgi:hypothetical protein